ncbi:hypothetical protein [Nitrospira sp. Nam74]
MQQKQLQCRKMRVNLEPVDVAIWPFDLKDGHISWNAQSPIQALGGKDPVQSRN